MTVNQETAESVIRLADLAVERGCYLPLLPKQRLAADKAQMEMDCYRFYFKAFCDAAVYGIGVHGMDVRSIFTSQINRKP